MAENDYEIRQADPGIGVMRMRGVVENLKGAIPGMVDPDYINPCGDGGALAVWGINPSIVIQMGSSSSRSVSDEPKCYFQATLNGNKCYVPEIEWKESGHGVDGRVIAEIKQILPHILKQREGGVSAPAAPETPKKPRQSKEELQALLAQWEEV